MNKNFDLNEKFTLFVFAIFFTFIACYPINATDESMAFSDSIEV